MVSELEDFFFINSNGGLNLMGVLVGLWLIWFIVSKIRESKKKSKSTNDDTYLASESDV